MVTTAFRRQIVRTAHRFGLDIRRVGSTPADFPLANKPIGERSAFMTRRYSEILDTPGTIVECGVAAGRSFLVLCMLADLDPKPRDVWGFDSFEGFPEVSVHDASERMASKGDKGQHSAQKVEAILRHAGLSDGFVDRHVHLVKGFVEDTLPGFDEPIALLHIDLDLYEAYRTALTHLWPQVVPGGVVLFDEYREPKWPGATKAIDEYFHDLDVTIEHDAFVNRYFVRKPA